LLGSSTLQPADYPPEGVLLYGALFALALAFVYLPTAVTLRRTGHALRDAVASALLSSTGERPPNDIARWFKLQALRREMCTSPPASRMPSTARTGCCCWGAARGGQGPALGRFRTSRGVAAAVPEVRVDAVDPHAGAVHGAHRPVLDTRVGRGEAEHLGEPVALVGAERLRRDGERGEGDER